MRTMKKQHCWIKAEIQRGTPFPLIPPEPLQPAAPKSA
jgi:hypothetical protein